MRQLAQHLGFVEEARDELLVLGKLGMQRLQRDSPIEGLLPRLVHRTHAPFAKEADDPVRAQALTFGESGHGGRGTTSRHEIRGCCLCRLGRIGGMRRALVTRRDPKTLPYKAEARRWRG